MFIVANLAIIHQFAKDFHPNLVSMYVIILQNTLGQFAKVFPPILSKFHPTNISCHTVSCYGISGMLHAMMGTVNEQLEDRMCHILSGFRYHLLF